MPVIGYVSLRSADSDVLMVAAFRRGLNEAGYIEGKNVAIEYWPGVCTKKMPIVLSWRVSASALSRFFAGQARQSPSHDS